MKSVSTTLSRIVATVFFIGHIPFAPGTFGTLAGVVVVYIFKPDATQLLLLIVTGFAVGVVTATSAEASYGEEDCRHIVIDEVVGYFVSVLLLPPTPGYIVAAFFLFRLFDILKPPPLRYLERALGGGLAIMADDVGAGIYTNAVLQCIAYALGGKS